MNKIGVIAVGFTLAVVACGTARAPAIEADLAITNARVLDVRSGRILPRQTVLVKDGIIVSVSASGRPPARTRNVIDAHSRLLTPGFIDAHLHLCNIFCESNAPDSLAMSLSPDSLDAYRRRLGDQYFPYGVTTVRDAGSDERFMPVLLGLMARSSLSPDFYPVGAHLISPQARPSNAPWQVVVADSAAAAAKVREYHALGIRNVKLYWRLREPEFRAALAEARRLGMNVAGHVDLGVMGIDRAIALGLRNFEHVHPFGYSVLTDEDFDALVQQAPRTLNVTPPNFPPTALFMNVPEIFNYLGPHEPRVLSLIEQLRRTNGIVTPTLHVFAQRYGLTYFESAPRDSTEDTSVWTQKQRDRTRAGYRVMTSYVKRLHDRGVRLAVGSDTPDPGKSVLSEMLLLHEAGIPMTDVFRIATLDSAEAIGAAALYGSIEAGKRANFVLFGGDPLNRPMDLLGARTVIKDGYVVAPIAGSF